MGGKSGSNVPGPGILHYLALCSPTFLLLHATTMSSVRPSISDSSSGSNPNSSSSTSASSTPGSARHPGSQLPQPPSSSVSHSQPQHEPYHITHGATAYQQITSRGNKQQPLLFSQSGFDVVEVLSRVSKRPNPTVNIGSVDFSCAFIVADAQKADWPIVYASPPLVSVVLYRIYFLS